jgi:hypothetical protein
MVCYAGDDENAAAQAIQPLRTLGGATPVSDDIAQKPYDQMLEDAKNAGPMKVRVRNGFATDLSPDLLKAIADNFGIPNSPPIQVRSLGGAFARVDNSETAFAHRAAEALMIMPSFSPADVPEDQANAAADKLWAPLRPYIAGSYVNFLTDIMPASIDAAYPLETRLRLARIKAQYDPTNLFRDADVKPPA